MSSRKKILEKYAQVLVNFALNSGQGIKKGEVVAVMGSEASKPLYAAVLHAVWKSGGHVLQKYTPDNESWFSFDGAFYECAGEEQLTHFPKTYLKGLVEQVDHSIFLIAETDKMSLKDIDPEKIMKRRIAMKPYSEWRNKKESLGKFTWTVALYGTPHMAKDVNLTQEQYWEQIIQACYLDEKDPVAKWKKLHEQMQTYIEKLNTLPIEKLHVVGDDVDLWLTLGEKRKWAGGGGRNIPSFEIFTSPDWRGTEGWIRFNQPLYQYGSLIDGIELTFKKGIVVESKVKKNENLLKKMIEVSNADKIGEFSLTDSRFSRITKFMGETLYDENVGGEYGNTHIALGDSFRECFAGDSSKISKGQWKKLGFNDSSIHTDIVSTTDRTVTAFLTDGTEKVIYKKGKFTL
ncbi:TPA: aminopeptidase [Patescibacteria group bacterium]|nr:aminopeptidase [Patescibacteria group bacterium]